MEKENYQYISSGKFRSQDSWIHSERCIDSNEMIYVISGNVYIEEDGIPYTLNPRDILFLENHRTHKGFSPSMPGTSFYWVHFAGKLPFKYFSLPKNHQLNFLLERLLHYSCSPEYPKKICDLAISIIIMEAQVFYEKYPAAMNKLLVNILEYIRINADKKITVEDIAKTFDYNKNYLSRFFQSYYPRGLKNYIDETRINYIKNLLFSENYSLKQIALQTGFENYKDFLKYFKYHTTYSPSEFKKLYFNTHINKK